MKQEKIEKTEKVREGKIDEQKKIEEVNRSMCEHGSLKPNHIQKYTEYIPNQIRKTSVIYKSNLKNIGTDSLKVKESTYLTFNQENKALCHYKYQKKYSLERKWSFHNNKRVNRKT